MSHISSSKLRITNIITLRDAVSALVPGAELVKADEYTWFGYSMGDYVPDGFTKDELGKCEWKIKLPGVKYEIGLAKPKGESGYALLYDHFSAPAFGDQEERHDGMKLLRAFGTGEVKDGLSKLATEYRHRQLEKEARRMGRKVERIDSAESLSKWNRAMRATDSMFKPLQWKGKVLTVVSGG